jgi:hypothetical protein
MRYKILLLILFSLLFVSNITSAKTNKKDDEIFNDFLSSSSLLKKEKAYLHILQNKKAFSDKLFHEIKKYQTKNTIPNELIYLATIFREERFLKPLINMIENPEYSESACIYSCPIVFSLTVYECFSKFSLPDNLNKKLTAVSDLFLTIDSTKNISLKREKINTSGYSPKAKTLFAKLENLTIDQLIEKAGPNNPNYLSRTFAALILSYSIDNEKHIKKLYWLAITEIPDDASREYRSAIYRAIYRAEAARIRRKN